MSFGPTIISTLRSRPTYAKFQGITASLHPKRMGSTKSPFELKPKYANFKKVQASRPKFDATLPITFSQSPDPDWKYGQGATDVTALEKSHTEIDPYADDRAMISNYKVLIAGVPRPISFVSTLSIDGVANLAPFSYFQVVDHDPPIFVIGFSARSTRPKDTRRNLLETGECVINVVSEHMIEAVNATSLDVPYGTSEWEFSGLHQAETTTVKPKRVREAVFSIEAKLMEMKELNYGKEGSPEKPSGALAILKATRFWIRGDALNETKDDIDLSVLRPLVQLGGMQYSRVRETFELPRPSLPNELADPEKGLSRFIDPDIKK